VRVSFLWGKTSWSVIVAVTTAQKIQNISLHNNILNRFQKCNLQGTA